jgi:dual specificity phosphatase 12
MEKEPYDLTLHHIRPGLYLGSRLASVDRQLLAARNIRRVLTVGPARELTQPFSDIKYKRFPIDDKDGVNLLKGLPAAFSFIDDALKKNESVLVHCLAGISRSASIVIAYVMKSEGLQFEQALLAVQTRRNEVFPNIGFKKQLVCFGECNYDSVAAAKRLGLQKDCLIL